MLHTLPLSYCAELVRAHDRERYLCTLFAPASCREAWFVLFAFDYEIATIAHKVSEPMLGHIRFAWWREALDEIYVSGAVRKHPVVEALAQVVRDYKLPRTVFDVVMDAHMHDLEPETFTTSAALKTYSHDTSSALLQLCAIVAGVPWSEALRELGIAWGLTMAARAKLWPAIEPELLDAAAEHVPMKVDAAFEAFAHTCRFILKRLRAGKNPDNYFLLTLVLWWKA